jgi:hypothetical protein
MECRNCILAQADKGRVVCFVTGNYRIAKDLRAMEGIIYGCPEEKDFMKRYSAPIDNPKEKK